MTLHYTAHLKIYTFTGTNTGRIGSTQQDQDHLLRTRLTWASRGDQPRLATGPSA